MKTMEVLDKVMAGKMMSESSRRNYVAVFGNLSKMYDEFPTKAVEVNEWLVSLNGYADQSIRLWFMILKSACEYVEVNFGLVNACKGIKSPKVRKLRRRYHKAEDLVKIIQACRSEYETGLIMTLIDSSCRVGGLEGLKGSDVGDGWIDVKEKTGDRRYRLDVRLCEVLKRMAGSDDQLVFGKTRNALTMMVIRISKRAGLTGDKLGPHTIRHSSASLVAGETKNALAVKALLQHDNIQTSMLYIHDIDEEYQKGISPLKIVGDRVGGAALYRQKQLPVKASSDGVVAEVIDDDGLGEVVGDMFPVIGEGLTIHSRLKSDDLNLIREGFIELARRDKFGSQAGKARLLLKRMLRKVKV